MAAAVYTLTSPGLEDDCLAGRPLRRLRPRVPVVPARRVGVDGVKRDVGEGGGPAGHAYHHHHQQCLLSFWSSTCLYYALIQLVRLFCVSFNFVVAGENVFFIISE